MPDELSASELIRRCRGGDPAAREQLFDRYRHYLRLLAQAQLGRYLPAKCDPSDLVQETLIAVHTKRSTYDRARPFSAWLYAIARYKMADHFRRSYRLSPSEGLDEEIAAPVSARA